jgi:hypothetical protein
MSREFRCAALETKYLTKSHAHKPASILLDTVARSRGTRQKLDIRQLVLGQSDQPTSDRWQPLANKVVCCSKLGRLTGLKQTEQQFTIHDDIQLSATIVKTQRFG